MSYRINKQIGIYTRFEEVDAAREQDQFEQWELGLNWWPTESVVVKLDYRDRSHDLDSANGRDFSAIDIGLGYHF
jgi:phosphate-selective porin